MGRSGNKDKALEVAERDGARAQGATSAPVVAAVAAAAAAAVAVPRRVRVLIVGPSLGILGGQAVVAARLLARLRDEPSLEVSFLPINPRLPGLLGELQRIKYVRTVLTSIAYVASLLWRVRACDCLHVFSASYTSFVLAPTPALLVAKLYGKPAVLNYHSGEAEDHLRSWQRTAVPTIRLADALAVPSRYLVEVFARFGLAARAIYNFVETDSFRFRPRPRLRPIFLANRNLESLYNVGCTLRAFALIQRRFPEATLTVAGDGSQRAALEQLARTLELRNTSFVGRVAQERMPELYERADIYLNSSDIDNMPVSLIEAYAAGCPVVTTDAGGIPYMLAHEETGLLVRRGDHEALAAAAMRLLEDDKLAQRLAANALAACQNYSWAATRDEWLKLYFELAHEEAATATRDGAIAPRVESKTNA